MLHWQPSFFFQIVFLQLHFPSPLQAVEEQHMPAEATSPGSELTYQIRDAGPCTPCVPIILVPRMVWDTKEGAPVSAHDCESCWQWSCGLGMVFLPKVSSIIQKGPLSFPKPQPLQKTNSIPHLILHSPGNLFFKKNRVLFNVYLFIFDRAGSLLLGGLFSHCSEWGRLFLAAHKLLIAVASLAEYRLSAHRLQ